MTVPELFFLVKKINQRQTNGYKMALAIAQNHRTAKPEALWKLLEKMEKPTEDVPAESEFNEDSFQRLRSAMGQNPRMIVK